MAAPYLYRGLGRMEAGEMLISSQTDGAFLIRESESMKGVYVLSLRYQGKVLHYRVLPSDKGYYLQSVKGLDQDRFESLESLVEFYKQESTSLVCRLMHPLTPTENHDSDTTKSKSNFPAASASGESEEIQHLRGKIVRLRGNSEHQQCQIDQLNTQLCRQKRRSNADQTAFNSVAENVVQQVCVTNDELTATKEQLAGQVRQLNEDRQSLRKQVSKLEEEVTKKQNELIQKQTIIDTLSHGSDELQKAMGKMMIDNGVLRQRVDDLQQLLGNAEAASEAAETRLADSKEVLKILGKDVRLSHMKLGSGSFGASFPLQEHTKFIYMFMYKQVVRVGYWRGCPVAVKILHEHLAKEHYQRRLFEKEVEVCSRLRHPNIAAICGVIQEDTAPFCLIMELLKASLADVIEAAHVSGRYLTVREQTDVSRDCLSGLTYLHELPRPILHGDIRPTNILMTSEMRAKLGDLGAARIADGSLSVGPMSPLYVAPERLADCTLPNSREADVYSMGVSLGELFTGDQMDRQDRPRQLRSIRQIDLRLVCVRMANEKAGERMMAIAALAVNDRVLETEEYNRCGPPRMVKGLLDGVDKVTLCDQP